MNAKLSDKLLIVLIAGCLLTGATSLFPGLANFQEVHRKPALATCFVGAALAFGLAAIALSRRQK